MAKRDVNLFMASTDDVQTLTEFAKKNDASFPILSDKSKQVARSYGVLVAGLFASRTTFVISPDGSIAHIENKVKTFNAGEQLLEILDKVM